MKSAFRTLLATLWLAVLAPLAAAYWEQIPGEASGIAVGGDGSVWAISTTRESGGYAVLHWNGSEFQKVSGVAGVRIAVDPMGNPWVVDSFNNLRHWNGRGWQNVRGWARDVAVGMNGSVWAVGLEGGLYEYRAGALEKRHVGGFNRVAVDPSGELWPIDERSQLVRMGPSGWQSVRDAASVSFGPNGSVWILDMGGNVFRLDASGIWVRRDGRFREIAVGPDGPWAVSSDFRIFRRLPDD